MVDNNLRDGDAERLIQEAQAIASIVVCNWRANHPGKGELHPDLLAMIEQAALNAITRRDAAFREAREEIERLNNSLREARKEVFRALDESHKKDAELATLRARLKSSEDVTETARQIVLKYIQLGCKFVIGKNVYAEWMKDDVAAALADAEAKEREACAKIAEEWMDETVPKRIRARAEAKP